MSNLKRPHRSKSDMNNNEIIPGTSTQFKKKKTCISTTTKDKQLYTIGQIKELGMLNFMCHKNFLIEFNATSMQIVTGANGSGKTTSSISYSFDKIIFSR